MSCAFFRKNHWIFSRIGRSGPVFCRKKRKNDEKSLKIFKKRQKTSKNGQKRTENSENLHFFVKKCEK